jgi:hypothetical protein
MELKENFHEAVASIPLDKLQHILQNISKRFGPCRGI